MFFLFVIKEEFYSYPRCASRLFVLGKRKKHKGILYLALPFCAAAPLMDPWIWGGGGKMQPRPIHQVDAKKRQVHPVDLANAFG